MRVNDVTQNGMEKLGLVSFLKKYNSPEIMSIVFPSSTDMEISPEAFLEITDFQLSHKRNDRTIEFFKKFLCDLHNGLISKSWNDYLYVFV